MLTWRLFTRSVWDQDAKHWNQADSHYFPGTLLFSHCFCFSLQQSYSQQTKFRINSCVWYLDWVHKAPARNSWSLSERRTKVTSCIDGGGLWMHVCVCLLYGAGLLSFFKSCFFMLLGFYNHFFTAAKRLSLLRPGLVCEQMCSVIPREKWHLWELTWATQL